MQQTAVTLCHQVRPLHDNLQRAMYNNQLSVTYHDWILATHTHPFNSPLSGTTRVRQPRQHSTTQFLQAGCPSCHPTNSIKALKGSWILATPRKKTFLRTSIHSQKSPHHSLGLLLRVTVEVIMISVRIIRARLTPQNITFNSVCKLNQLQPK